MAYKCLMFPPELLSLDALQHAALGAAGGMAIYLVVYAIRDRRWLLHRFETRRRLAAGDLDAHNWHDEPEGYVPGVVEERERRGLKSSLGFAAALGAGFWLSSVYQSEFLLFLGLAGAALISTFRLLTDDDAALIDAEVGEEAGAPLGFARRWRLIALNLGIIAYFAANTLGPVRDTLRDWFDAAPALFYGGGALLAALTLWAAATAMDEDAGMPMWRSYGIPREAVFGAIGGLAMLSAIVLFASSF